ERCLLLAGAFDQLGGGVPNRQDVTSVHTFALDTEGGATFVQVGFGRGALDGGAHTGEVVDHHEHDGQVPQFGDVQRLVPGADVGGAVAHLAHDDLVTALVGHGHGGAGGQWQLSADDAVPAEQSGLGVVHVHGTAPTLGDAVHAPVELGHDTFGVHALFDRVPVVAIVREEVVGLAQGRHQTDHRGLLAEVEVAVAADTGLGVGLRGALLEPTDVEHPPVVVEESVLVLLAQVVGGVLAAAPFGPGGPGGAAFRLGRVSHGVPFFVREGPPFRLVSRKGEACHGALSGAAMACVVASAHEATTSC